MHSDEAKKHSVSPHAFWPHPHAFCFMLFVLILVQWILGILDAANLGPLFKILQNSLKQKHLGFLKHLKKWFMGCLVQVSQTPPPAGVSIKFTPQSNRNNDSLSKVNTIVYKNLYVNMVCNFWIILWIKLVLTFKGEGRGQPSLKQYIFSYFEVVSVNKPGRSVYFNKTNLGWLKDWSFLAILGNFWPF